MTHGDVQHQSRYANAYALYKGKGSFDTIVAGHASNDPKPIQQRTVPRSTNGDCAGDRVCRALATAAPPGAAERNASGPSMAVSSTLAVQMAAIAIDRSRVSVYSTHGEDTCDQQQYSDQRGHSLCGFGTHITFLGSSNCPWQATYALSRRQSN